MDPIAVVNGATSALFAAGIVLVFVAVAQERLRPRVGLFIAAPLLLNLAVALGNVFEHSGVTAAFDPFEEYLEIATVPYFLLFVYAMVTGRELERREEHEEALSSAIEERTLLLKEIHHRVKNNLQTLSSLVTLQMGQSTTEEERAALRSLEYRVTSMGLLHKTLYQSDRYTLVEMRPYIESIIDHIERSHREAAERISFELSVDEIETNFDTAIPCGLIVNELVTNAVRHAFAAGRDGAVRVALAEDEPDRYRLTISDNGGGVAEANERAREGIGLQLVGALVAQLEGTLSLDRTGGTTYTIAFARVSKEERRWVPSES